ncbi:hypothetical protein ILYODFUR_035919 [Ilyodon furcidens]|uniref:Uncharacterized protein n=1 Tax=Ilyodon furcidens TaxID=33524 RepID=A0ABV0TGG0_9TELE
MVGLITHLHPLHIYMKSFSSTFIPSCLCLQITSLKDGQAQLPESPPLPLQEKGELHWVAKFIISANDLGGLKKTWGSPHFSPEGLLELLYISVVGLIMM